MISPPKKTSDSHVDDHGSWMISYGDMITLLLAFFVLFFTVNPQKEKRDQLNRSLITELKQKKRQPASQVQNQVSMAIGETKDSSGISKQLVEDWGAKVHSVGQRIILEFPGVSFFELGEVAPTQEGKKVLETFMKIYEPYQGHYTLGIRAFTDQRQVIQNGRRYKDNLELSALRAVATMRELQKLGVPLRLMRLGGYGELVISEERLREMKKNESFKDQGASALDLARTVVLVIEPVSEEDKPADKKGADNV